MLTLLAAGLCALVGWSAFRLIRPEKFRLRRVPARANRVGLLHVVVVFLLYHLCLQLAAAAVAAVRGIRLTGDAQPPMTVMLPAGMIGQLLLIAASAAVAAMTFRHGLRRGLGLSGRRWLWDAARAVVGFLVVLPLVYLVFVLTSRLLEALRPEWIRPHPILVFLPGASGAWRAAAIFAAVVLAAVAEELFYRGLLQSMLKRQFGGRAWPAVLAASAVFAASHYNQLHAMGGLFVLAVGLGYNYERTGRLLCPILMHAIFNASMIWVSLSG